MPDLCPISWSHKWYHMHCKRVPAWQHRQATRSSFHRPRVKYPVLRRMFGVVYRAVRHPQLAGRARTCGLAGGGAGGPACVPACGLAPQQACARDNGRACAGGSAGGQAAAPLRCRVERGWVGRAGRVCVCVCIAAAVPSCKCVFVREINEHSSQNQQKLEEDSVLRRVAATN